MTQNVQKNNDQICCGLTWKRGIGVANPTIYLESYFAAYQAGDSIDQLASKAIDFLEEGIKNAPEIDIVTLTDYSRQKENIFPVLINAESNREFLENKPHTPYAEDLAIIYRCKVQDFADACASFVITDDMLKNFNVSLEELNRQAFDNTRPQYSFTDLCETIPMIPAGEMYVLSNSQKLNGAVSVCDPAVMMDVAEALDNAEFAIIPSSIHELLIVPAQADRPLRVEDLASMIRDVNETNVEPGERLSDHPYVYDYESRSLVPMTEDIGISHNKDLDMAVGFER